MSIGNSLQILSDPTRRAILQLLKEEKQTAGAIAEALNISPAALSYHLKLLKKGDFLLEYREKNFIWYEINTSIFDDIILWAKEFRGEKHEEKHLDVDTGADSSGSDHSGATAASGTGTNAL